MTKPELYVQINTLRNRLKIKKGDYPIDSAALCASRGIVVRDLDLKTSGLRGMAVQKSKPEQQDIIILKEDASETEKNFNCAHEFMHLFFHRGTPGQTFNCFEKVAPNQNSFIEWQANEGAAEFLVPYSIFIPLYIAKSRQNAKKHLWDYGMCEDLGDYFHVTPGVIHNRITSLDYTISYYMQKGTLTNAPICSQRQLERIQGYKPHRRIYCLNCTSVILDKQKFCHICGSPLIEMSFENLVPTKQEGAGYMKYPGIEMNSKQRAKVCPHCGNDELPDGDYCSICGIFLRNICVSSLYDPCQYNEEEPCCEGTNINLPGNARYCPCCGRKTTFFEKKLLLAWNDKNAPMTSDEDLPF